MAISKTPVTHAPAAKMAVFPGIGPAGGTNQGSSVGPLFLVFQERRSFKIWRGWSLVWILTVSHQILKEALKYVYLCIFQIFSQ